MARSFPRGRRCIVVGDPLESTPGWHGLAQQDRVEIVRMTTFLRSHGARGSAGPAHEYVCSCGRPSVRRVDDGSPEGKLEAVRNDACDCPCHEPGWFAPA